MATRLQDAKIRVTIETDQAQQDLDNLNRQEKDLEQRTQAERRKAKEVERAPSAPVSQIRSAITKYTGMLDFASQVAAPVLEGITEAVIKRLPQVLVSDEFKSAIVKEVNDDIAALEAKAAKLTSMIDSIAPTVEMTKQMLHLQMIAGGHPDVSEVYDVARNMFEIQRKKVELQKKVQREQNEALGREVSNTILEAAKSSMSR